MVIKIILALVTGYLLGSIPTAYIVTRIARGGDIRQLGGGNVGTLNTLKVAGRLPGLVVMVVDIGKGAAAIAIAYYVFGLEPQFVLAAGIAAVIGHMWMVFLKFSGGRGMGTSIGTVITAFCIYGDWYGLIVFIVVAVIPLVITFNVPLALAVAFIALPFIIWFTANSITGTVAAVILGLLVGGKFATTAIAAWKKAGTKREFFFIDRKTFGKKDDNQDKT